MTESLDGVPIYVSATLGSTCICNFGSGNQISIHLQKEKNKIKKKKSIKFHDRDFGLFAITLDTAIANSKEEASAQTK